MRVVKSIGLLTSCSSSSSSTSVAISAQCGQTMSHANDGPRERKHRSRCQEAGTKCFRSMEVVRTTCGEGQLDCSDLLKRGEICNSFLFSTDLFLEDGDGEFTPAEGKRLNAVLLCETPAIESGDAALEDIHAQPEPPYPDHDPSANDDGPPCCGGGDDDVSHPCFFQLPVLWIVRCWKRSRGEL